MGDDLLLDAFDSVFSHHDLTETRLVLLEVLVDHLEHFLRVKGQFVADGCQNVVDDQGRYFLRGGGYRASG